VLDDRSSSPGVLPLSRDEPRQQQDEESDDQLLREAGFRPTAVNVGQGDDGDRFVRGGRQQPARARERRRREGAQALGSSTGARVQR
jgi:hypothetical protein